MLHLPLSKGSSSVDDHWGPEANLKMATIAVCLCPDFSPRQADNFRKTLKTHLFRNALGHLAH